MFDKQMIDELKSMPSVPHDDALDAEIISKAFLNISKSSGIPVKVLCPAAFKYQKIKPDDIHFDVPEYDGDTLGIFDHWDD